jgi:hypothetical protein
VPDGVVTWFSAASAGLTGAAGWPAQATVHINPAPNPRIARNFFPGLTALNMVSFSPILWFGKIL